MTTLAGRKVREHREAAGLTRAQFGATLGGVPGATVQGWEEHGKIPRRAHLTALARAGIVAHEDWYLPALCARCELRSDAVQVKTCGERDCPLAHRRAA